MYKSQGRNTNNMKKQVNVSPSKVNNSTRKGLNNSEEEDISNKLKNNDKKDQ
jgi:hypothetical protein